MMRRRAGRPDAAATVTLWGLNFTVTKYVLYARLPAARLRQPALSAWRRSSRAFAYARERSFSMRRARPRPARRRRADRDLPEPAHVRLRDQADDGDDGRAPLRHPAGVRRPLRFALGIERLGLRFWLAAVLAFGGVALVAVGSGGGLSKHSGATCSRSARRSPGRSTPSRSRRCSAATRRSASARSRSSPGRSRSRIGSAASSPPRTTASAPRSGSLLAFAVIGPLVVANLLWFGAIAASGRRAPRSSPNPQPFLAAVFALLLLSEPLTGFRSPAASRSPRAIAAPARRPVRRACAGAGAHDDAARAARAHAARLPVLDRPNPRDLLGPDGGAAARGARPDDRRDRAAAGSSPSSAGSRSTRGSSPPTCSARR